MMTRANYFKLNRAAVDSLIGVGKALASIDKLLRALVETRVSQINGCVFCLNMHAEEARAAGERQQRLDCLAGWRESQLFDDAERAALGWAESLTNISQTHAPDDTYEALTAHFSEAQIVDLTFIISCMNAWNRVAIGHRAQPAKR